MEKQAGVKELLENLLDHQSVVPLRNVWLLSLVAEEFGHLKLLITAVLNFYVAKLSVTDSSLNLSPSFAPW